MVYRLKEEMMVALGKNLSALRLSMNISQQDLADRSGISLKAVRNLESGKNSSTLSLMAVSKTLRKTDWLMTFAPPEIDASLFERKDPEKRRKRAASSRKGTRHG